MARIYQAVDRPITGADLLPASGLALQGRNDATIVLRGAGFVLEVFGAGLDALPDTARATVTGFRVSRDGVVLYGVEGASVTGEDLRGWLFGGPLLGQSAYERGFLGGADLVTGGNFADWLEGGAGADTLFGYGGDDTLEGGAGDDVLWAGAGRDVLVGGEGRDVAATGAPRRLATVEGTPTLRTLSGPDGPETLSSVEAIRFRDGTLDFDPFGPAARVHRLYEAVLDRAPDPVALSEHVAALASGRAGLADLALGLVRSAEFAARFPWAAGEPGALVAQFYRNLTGAEADAGGHAYWTGLLRAGAADAGRVALGLSDSPEQVARTSAAVGARGLWAADEAAVDVVRLYAVVLDRAPDGPGLLAWLGARDAGATRGAVADAIAAAPEFAARYGGLSDSEFVAQLYRNALDREADPGGHAFWVTRLAPGAGDRGDVAEGLAVSPELGAKIAPLVADGVAFA